jgi:hypothetical protein
MTWKAPCPRPARIARNPKDACSGNGGARPVCLGRDKARQGRVSRIQVFGGPGGGARNLAL